MTKCQIQTRCRQFNMLLAFFAITLLFAITTKANDQLDSAAAHESNKIRQYDQARDIALAVFLNDPFGPGAEEALRMYVRNAIRSGHAEAAILYSNRLCDIASYSLLRRRIPR